MKTSTDAFLLWPDLVNEPAHRLFQMSVGTARAFSAVLSLLHAETDAEASQAARQALEGGVPALFLRQEAALADRPQVFRVLREVDPHTGWWQEHDRPESSETSLSGSLVDQALTGALPAWVLQQAVLDGFDPVRPLARHPRRPPKTPGWPVDPGCSPLAAALSAEAFEAAETLWTMSEVCTQQDTLDDAFFWMASTGRHPKALAWAHRLLAAGADPNRAVSVMPCWAGKNTDPTLAGWDTSGRRWARRLACEPRDEALDGVWADVFPRLRVQQWPVLLDDALGDALRGIERKTPGGQLSARQALDVLLASQRPTTAADTLVRALGAILNGELGRAQTQEQRETLVEQLQEVRPRSDAEVFRQALRAASEKNGFWPLAWATAAMERPLTLKEAIEAFQRGLSRVGKTEKSWDDADDLSEVRRGWEKHMSEEDGQQWGLFLDEAAAIAQGVSFDKLNPEQLQALQLLGEVGAQPTRRPAARRL